MMSLSSITKGFFLSVLFLCSVFNSFSHTNPHHVKVSGYTRKDGTYVQPYFRTAPNNSNIDNFSTKGNVNPYNGKPGWIAPDSEYNTFYYNTYTYQPAITESNNATNSTQLIKYENRTYIEDELGNYTCYPCWRASPDAYKSIT